jgi:hypothetical protein
MWRVAIYAREAPGRANRTRLDRQVAGLAARVARQADWQHVATYADQRELGALLTRLGAVGVRTVVLRPPVGRRIAKLVANVALADLIGEAAR